MAIISLKEPMTFEQFVDRLGSTVASITFQKSKRLIHKTDDIPIRKIFLMDQPLKNPKGAITSTADATTFDADILVAPDPCNMLWSLRNKSLEAPLPIVGINRELTAKKLKKILNSFPVESRMGVHDIDSLNLIADRVANNIGGHIIVEDSNFQLLGYSRVMAHTDQARKKAILQRQLPDKYQQIFNNQGVFARLIRGEDIIETKAVHSVELGKRLIVAIRNNDQLLGTIWLARDNPPFTKADIAELAKATQELRPLLLDSLRFQKDKKIKSDEFVRSLLFSEKRNYSKYKKTINQLTGINGSADAHVIAISLINADSDSMRNSLHLVKILAESNAQSLRIPALFLVDFYTVYIIYFGCSYSVSRCNSEAPLRFSERLIQHLTKIRIPVAIGIGGHVSATDSFSNSARNARDSVDTLKGFGESRVLPAQELWAKLVSRDFIKDYDFSFRELPLKLTKLLNDRNVQRLDANHTLRVVLDYWGDIPRISKKKKVPTATLR